jgi:hypothetical protein
MIIVAPFQNRVKFGGFLASRKLNGIAVEVGTDRGDFALPFLEDWNRGTKLHCVDPWTSGYDDEDPTSRRKDRNEDRRLALNRLRGYIHAGRCQIWQATSLMACGTFQDASLDFVYIDGCHQPESVREDMRVWWSKLRAGGILAGHDFAYWGEPNWGRHVQLAVLEFAAFPAERSEPPLDVFVVVEDDRSPWSWYMVKS